MENTAESTIETPLATIHRAAGAKMGVWFGCALPDDWGNPQEEQRFANQSVALIDKNYRAYFTFTGPDRVRYLNAILTNNIKDLREGEGAISLLLNSQGRIRAELETFAGGDELFCVSYLMIRERLMELLDKYIIMDDVSLTDVSDKFGTLALEGPLAEKIALELTDLDLTALSPLGWTQGLVNPVASGSVAPIPCRIVKRSGTSVPAVEFVVQLEHLEPLWNALLKATHVHGGGPMGYRALSAQRLAQGIPWFGYDFSEKQIPHEAGLEFTHISYTKGCYTGQEIVERVRSRGQVNRRRVELLFSGDGVPETGASLTVNEQTVGYVTRAARSWFPAAVLGMGYVGKDHRALGTVVKWSGGSAIIEEFQNALRPAQNNSGTEKVSRT
jgi:folate-binding protein YgfZ